MKTRVLIVEDDMVVASQLQIILEKNDYTVSTCNNYKDFKDELTIYQPDLILLDINLDGRYEGLQMGSYLNNNSQTPFIYITGHTDTQTLKRVQMTEPAGFLSKPFREVDVISNIEVALYNSKSSKEIKEDEEDERLYSRPVKRTIEFIAANLNDKITMKDLEKVSGWSRFHLIRQFDKEVGMTPYKYIYDQKMKFATLKLKNTTQPINEIAFDLGYISNSSFTNAFVKSIGVSPTTYRKKFSN